MKQEYASNIFHRIPQIYPIEEAFATLKRWIKLNYVMMDNYDTFENFLEAAMYAQVGNCGNHFRSCRQFTYNTIKMVTRATIKSKTEFEWEISSATITAKGVAKANSLKIAVKDEEGWKN